MADDVVARLGRPSWRDPRLGVGVLLVAGSVALGGWAVSQASETVEVYVAVDALTPGDNLREADLRPQVVPPGPLEGVYVPVDDGLPPDAVVTRVVGAGELLPAGALGSAEDVDLRPVVVTLDGAVPAGVDKGSVVDLWVAEPAPSAIGEDVGTRPEPTLLAGGLIVAKMLESDSIFAGASGAAAQVLVPQAELPTVLSALSGDATIVVIPVPGGAP